LPLSAAVDVTIGRRFVDTRVAAEAQPHGFAAWLSSFLIQELAPSRQRLRTTLRIAVLTTLAAGIGAALQLEDGFAPVTVWRIYSTSSPMIGFLEATSLALIAAISESTSLILAGILSEAPWFELGFIGVITALSTYVFQGLGLSSAWILIQIGFLSSFFIIVFDSRTAGTATAVTFAGMTAGYALAYVADNFIWLENSERDLLESLAQRIERNRHHVQRSTAGYLSLEVAARIPSTPTYTMLATHLALLAKVNRQQPDQRRRQVMLSAVGQGEQIHHAAMVIAYLARADLPRHLRTELRPELEAVFAALDTSLRDRAEHTLAGLHQGEGENCRRDSAAHLERALGALRKRMAEMPPEAMIATSAEASNLNSFVRELHRLAGILEHTPEELPPAVSYAPPKRQEQMRLAASLGLPQDRRLARHSVKTGIAVSAAYVVLLVSHRPELSVMIQTVLLIGPPAYGAQLRRVVLRIGGGMVGAILAIPTIMLMSSNFESIGGFMAIIFLALLIASYLATSTTRISYCGLQGGLSFILAIAPLAPSVDVTEPLWRIWATLVGLMVAGIVFLIYKPEYSGRALVEQMPAFMRAVIEMIPVAGQEIAESRMRALQMYTSKAWQDLLAVAEDARLEGYRSGIDHMAVVDAASNLGRIAYRLGDIALDRGSWSDLTPRPVMEARDAYEKFLRQMLADWLASFEQCQTRTRRQIQELAHPPRYEDLRQAFTRLEELTIMEQIRPIVDLPERARLAVLSDLEGYRRITNRARSLDRALRRVVIGSPG
jgi:hypothetical protein